MSNEFKKLYIRIFCLDIMWGYVYDKREYLYKKGICVVGNNFFSIFLSYSKSFILLFTYTFNGVVFIVYKTKLGTNTFGFIT
jgi:hypothetical protein